jgi:hypothetical protein
MGVFLLLHAINLVEFESSGLFKHQLSLPTLTQETWSFFFISKQPIESNPHAHTGDLDTSRFLFYFQTTNGQPSGWEFESPHAHFLILVNCEW